MKTKDAIFLSHSASDSLAANALADYLHDVFDCRVFLSEEIETGEKWRDAILSALNDCRAVVVLATPNSIDRIWVNFEIGAAHALAKPVLPICAGGLAIDSLPDTLNDRQAAMLENDEDCRRILQTLRSHLGRRANLMKVGRKLPQFEIVAHPKNGFKAMPRRDESFAQAASEILAAACRDKTELRVAGVANTIFFGAQARLSRELHNALRDGMKARFIFLDPVHGRNATRHLGIRQIRN